MGLRAGEIIKVFMGVGVFSFELVERGGVTKYGRGCLTALDCLARSTRICDIAVRPRRVNFWMLRDMPGGKFKTLGIDRE